MTARINDIITTARAMAQSRVPFVHQGRSWAGVDCAGLVLVAAWDNGLDLPDWPEPYGRAAFGQRLVRAMRCCGLEEIPVSEMGHGDLGCMWFDKGTRELQHVYLVYDDDRIVHAYEGSKVVSDVALTRKYVNRTGTAFRFPGSMVRR